MADSVEQVRRWYAEELRFTARVSSPSVVDAFATVPRERFVGPGPWLIKSPMNLAEYWMTEDADPRHVYHDVLIALDEARGINNGQPSLWAYLFNQIGIVAGEDALHLGCGTGYYTAIAAELVGSTGKVTAIEIDATLAEKARAALPPWPQVTVNHADGARTSFDPVDLIIASAGATHPLLSWIDALKPGGRLLFPMTTDRGGPGAMLLVTRRAADEFAARFLCRAGFIDFKGARNQKASRRLEAALDRDRGAAVKSLRRDTHTKDEACWLHGEGWCLSRLDPGGVNSETS
jgi:protein-L-isoaspartate(D-aspartate) O-methyltransferase